jgi:DNA-binding NarL/FixJ family response regulator
VSAAITVLVANSKELIRLGLRAMLAKSVRIVGEANSGDNLLSLVKKHRPQVLLMDTAMPGESDCFALLRKFAKSFPDMKSILLSAVDNPTYMARAKAAGVSDFLLESVTSRDLVTAIENAASGKVTKGTGAFARICASMAGLPQSATRDAKLTPREGEVLSHVAYGLSNDEIARSLRISVETVKEHMQNLLRKLGVNDRTQAAVWAVRSGME